MANTLSVNRPLRRVPLSVLYQKYHAWVANALTLFALVALLSPKVASQSISPWVAFLVMNVIYLIDGLKSRKWGWVYLCAFGASWDVLLIVSRLTQLDVFGPLQPLIVFLENLP